MNSKPQKKKIEKIREILRIVAIRHAQSLEKQK